MGNDTKVHQKLAAQARTVSAALIARFLRGATIEEVVVWIDGLPRGQRRVVVGAPLGLLFLAALAAAHFGLLGLCVFFLGVILIMR